jgi:hypothetical protein
VSFSSATRRSSGSLNGFTKSLDGMDPAPTFQYVLCMGQDGADMVCYRSRAKIAADFWVSSLGRLVKAILALSVLLVSQAPGIAMATLGGPAQSIAADQQALGGQIRMLNQPQSSARGQALREQMPAPSKPAYTVEQISTPAGLSVNEYVSPNGTVFAVSWRGPRPPNLSQLLGSYFAEYQTAAASPQAQRGHLFIQSENLVVETGGHMRDLRGRAYVPALLPPGLSADDIQ